MRALVIFALTVTTSAMACPELAGTYARCQSNVPDSQSNSTDVVLTQSVVNGINIFELTETAEATGERETSSFPADGVTYEGEQAPDGLPISANVTISCRGTEALTFKNDIFLAGQPVGVFNTEVTKQGGRLFKRLTGNLFGTEINEEIVCE